MNTGFGHVAHGMGIYRSPIKVDRPERHGRYCFFPIAALVTAAARLKLALGQRLVEDEGGHIAYCDTDSLVIVASEKGGFVPCEVGEYVWPDGQRYIKALSYEQVDRILERLDRLNPYDRGLVRDMAFKKEHVEFDDAGRPKQLWFYGVRDKKYVICTFDEHGEPEIVKASAHGDGVYRSPIKGDRVQKNGVPKWLEILYKRLLRQIVGLPVERPEWWNDVATLRVSLTTWNSYKPYKNTCQPFDIVTAVTVPPKYKHLIKCCDNPRPAAVGVVEPGKAVGARWLCLRCGKRIRVFNEAGFPYVKTYGDVAVDSLKSNFQRKRLAASGADPSVQKELVGLTIPRPMLVKKIRYIGKEVIVDTSEAPIEEGQTAEELVATPTLEYVPLATQEAQRMLAAGVNVADAARISGVHRTTIKRIQNGQRPREKTARGLLLADPDPEPASANVQDGVRELVRNAGINAVSRAAGVSRSAVFEFLGGRDARVETLERLVISAYSILQPDALVVPSLPYVLVGPARK